MKNQDTSPPRRASRRQLSEDEWNALIAALDGVPARAAERYETARSGLIRIFRSRGFWKEAEELADQTIDRCARRVLEKSSTAEPIRNILAYMQAVAAKVASEARRHPIALPLDEIPEPCVFPAETQNPSGDFEERTLECLGELLRGLPAEDRAVILDYYRDSKGEKIARRLSLARTKNKSREALRVQVYRIRHRLGKELRAALSGEGERAKSGDP